MIIDYLPMKSGNYHEKQISYAPSSNKLSQESLKDLQNALTNFSATANPLFVMTLGTTTTATE